MRSQAHNLRCSATVRSLLLLQVRLKAERDFLVIYGMALTSCSEIVVSRRAEGSSWFLSGFDASVRVKADTRCVFVGSSGLASLVGSGRVRFVIGIMTRAWNGAWSRTKTFTLSSGSQPLRGVLQIRSVRVWTAVCHSVINILIRSKYHKIDMYWKDWKELRRLAVVFQSDLEPREVRTLNEKLQKIAYMQFNYC